MLKISAVYLIGNPEIPIHYTSLSQVEQALLMLDQMVVSELIGRGQKVLILAKNFDKTSIKV